MNFYIQAYKKDAAKSKAKATIETAITNNNNIQIPNGHAKSNGHANGYTNGHVKNGYANGHVLSETTDKEKVQ